ncbi:MAG: serine hydrolase [Chloroflexi bacterium]|nr:serine hydrolase [Lujinxingiaceae bacterium]MBA4171017.1 serine hydrolase [Chloroflexota bacterium]
MSILDFAAFARDHLRGLKGRVALLTPSAYGRMHTPVGPGSKTGLGWGVSTYRGNRASMHSGSAETFMALLLLLPDEDHAFVVVTNTAGNEAGAGTKLALQQLGARFTTAQVATGATAD